jgi:integrase
MSNTHQVKLTNDIIKGFAGEFGVLRDTVKSKLYFRYHAEQTKGSFYLVKRPGEGVPAKWLLLGRYPDMSVTLARAAYDVKYARQATGKPNVSGDAGSFTFVNDVLDWYALRRKREKGLSDYTCKNTLSTVKNRLLPYFAGVKIKDIQMQLVSERLYFPLQEKYAMSTFEQTLKVLKAAFLQASKMKLIDENVFAEMRYSDFCTVRPKRADCRFEQHDIKVLFKRLKELPLCDRMLPLMLLMHGTRIGETCAASFDRLQQGRWEIRGSETKTGTMNTIPLTGYANAMLRTYRQSLRKQINYRGQYLFFKKNHRQPISGSHGSTKVRELCNGQFSAHDLRKRARTWLQENGVDYFIGELLLGHRPPGLSLIYIQTYAVEQCAIALDMWHKYLVKNGLLEVLDA